MSERGPIRKRPGLGLKTERWVRGGEEKDSHYAGLDSRKKREKSREVSELSRLDGKGSNEKGWRAYGKDQIQEKNEEKSQKRLGGKQHGSQGHLLEHRMKVGRKPL